ncbi:SpoIID/LytB domain-containing protein, partial [Crocosphaera watsonii]
MLMTKTTQPIQGKHLFLTLFSLPLLWGGILGLPSTAKDVNIDVGIIQRFGETKAEKLSISATSGDSLTVKFQDSQGEIQTLTTTKLTLNIVQESLPQSLLKEYIVLSDHATFETAEDSANQWKDKGIKAEVTQPGRWQVWAKRDVYETPLLRRLLLKNLQEKGYNDAYLESAILNSKSQANFTIAGKQYQSDYLEIIPGKNPIQVSHSQQKTRRYGGSLKLQPNSYGTYTLVNDVPLETYLRGVVPHEIGPNAPKNAAKAQTIIARTYALRNLRRFKADNYELCASTHCQVYYGLSGTSPKADRAIAATKGLVLTHNNELVDALYSSTTGGVTASFSDAWNGEERPYLTAVIDSPKNVWDLSQKSLADEETFRNFIRLRQGFN